MRDVKLGTWACTTGDDVVEVTWSKVQVKFHPNEPNPSTRTGDKHEDFPQLKFRYDNIVKIELDYQRRAIRLRGQGQFGDKVDEDIYSPFGSPEAENSWLTMTFAGSAPEFTSSRSFLLKNVPELKPLFSVFDPGSALGGAASATAFRQPPAQNSMAGVREERKRERAAADMSRRATREPEPVLVYPTEECKDAVVLTNDDVWRLGNEELLNHELVDYYIKYIQATLEDSAEGGAQLSRCHFFNAFFYKRLCDMDASFYESVRRWTKNVDIFEKDFLFVPINEATHWSLAVVCWPGRITMPLPSGVGAPPCILYLDSRNGSNERALHRIRDYLLHEYRAKVLKQPVPSTPPRRRGRWAGPSDAAPSPAAQPELTLQGWEELQAKFKAVRTANVTVPQQHNDYAAGVYMLKFIDQAANQTEKMEAVANDAMRPFLVSQTRWARFFNGPGEKIDGRAIDEMRLSMSDAITAAGAAQQREKRRRLVHGNDADEVMVAAAPVLDAERAKTKALTEELGRLRREKAAAERAREEAENVLEDERAGRAEEKSAREAAEAARAEAERALARARGEAPALRPLEVDALDALQAEALAAAGRIQKAAAEKRAEKYVCPVCMDKEKDVALDPCGHRVCAECAAPRVCLPADTL